MSHGRKRGIEKGGEEEYCSALVVCCLFNYGHAWQELLYQTTVKINKTRDCSVAGCCFHSVHLHSGYVHRREGKEGDNVEVEKHVWVVQHEGGSTTNRGEKENEGERQKGGVSLRVQGKRKISQERKAHLCCCLPPTNCLFMWASTWHDCKWLAWYISWTHSSVWAQIHLQGCWAPTSSPAMWICISSQINVTLISALLPHILSLNVESLCSNKYHTVLHNRFE